MLYRDDLESKQAEDRAYVVPNEEGEYLQLTEIEKLAEFNLDELKQVYHNAFMDIQRYNFIDDICIAEDLYNKDELITEREILLMEAIRGIPVSELLNTEELLEMLIREHMTDRGFEKFQEELLVQFRLLQEKAMLRTN